MWACSYLSARTYGRLFCSCFLSSCAVAKIHFSAQHFTRTRNTVLNIVLLKCCALLECCQTAGVWNCMGYRRWIPVRTLWTSARSSSRFFFLLVCCICILYKYCFNPMEYFHASLVPHRSNVDGSCAQEMSLIGVCHEILQTSFASNTRKLDWLTWACLGSTL
jgi:hypothetical protein